MFISNLKNKKGFTLIELLAVIVILAIILVIAVPQILGVIQQSKEDSLKSSVRMFASAIETDYLVQMTSDSAPSGTVAAETPCPTGVAEFNGGTCCYELSTDANGVPTATVTIVGTGKFLGLTAWGTKTGTVTVDATADAAALHNCTP
jgi:prepilin-type N-terminal cleavage/methylation domain-containing protein